MRKYLPYVALYILSLANAYSFESLVRKSPAKDSIESFIFESLLLNEIVVTGSKPETKLSYIPMSVSVIDSKLIESRKENSILPLLSEMIPSLFTTSRGIMGYGVANGSAGGISIRGIGGTPSTGVLILIDGHPQFMGLMGHPLPDSYQSMMVDRVEVIRGPSSVLYGSNATGGVVNIITKKSKEKGVASGLKTMYGSHNTISMDAHNAYNSGKFSSFVSGAYNRTDGHRKNMEFEQYSMYGKVAYKASGNWETMADINLTQYDASNPGLISRPIEDNDSKVLRGMTSVTVANQYDNLSGVAKIYYNFGNHEINNGYFTVRPAIDSLFFSNDYLLGVTAYESLRYGDNNRVTLGFDYQNYGGNARNEYAIGTICLIDKQLSDVAGYVNVQQSLANRLVLNGGVRLDKSSLFSGIEIVPQAGLSYLLSESTTLKTSASKGFRNPTIRELYMFVPRNPQLKPESYMNYEVSASKKLLDYVLDLDVSLFYIHGKNAIQTDIVDGRPKYVNTGAIDNYGVEFAGNYKVSPSWHLTANYSWIQMKHKVIATPEHKFYCGANYSVHKWSLSTGIQLIQNLYTSVGRIETKESFSLWNARVSYCPHRKIELFAKGENLLNQRYEINNGYPMPQATVFGGLNLKI